MEQDKTAYQRFFNEYPSGFIIRLALFALALFLYRTVVHNLFRDLDVGLDQYVFNKMAAHVIHPKLTVFMKKITWFASARFLEIGTISLILLFIALKQYQRALIVWVVCVGGYLLNHLLKLQYQRIRPPDTLIEPLSNFSFPSGHATSGFIFYGLLAYLILKSHLSYAYKYLFATLLILFSLLIGYSRVYLRVHYFSDVVAGVCVGFSWLTLSAWVIEWLHEK